MSTGDSEAEDTAAEGVSQPSDSRVAEASCG